VVVQYTQRAETILEWCAKEAMERLLYIYTISHTPDKHKHTSSSLLRSSRQRHIPAPSRRAPDRLHRNSNTDRSPPLPPIQDVYLGQFHEHVYQKYQPRVRLPLHHRTTPISELIQQRRSGKRRRRGTPPILPALARRGQPAIARARHSEGRWSRRAGVCVL
jgi:hypothetical protein